VEKFRDTKNVTYAYDFRKSYQIPDILTEKPYHYNLLGLIKLQAIQLWKGLLHENSKPSHPNSCKDAKPIIHCLHVKSERHAINWVALDRYTTGLDTVPFMPHALLQFY